MAAMNWTNIRSICGMLGVLMAGSSCLGGLPADPGNAALLYYQALLLCPECEPATERMLELVSYGSEPNEPVRDYVKGCRVAIEYAEKASQIQDCDWGLWYSLGFSYRAPQWVSMRLLSRILQADARILAGDGEYRAALERCITMRRISRHAGTETVHFYALAMEIEAGAKRGICQILGSMTPDVETLSWLEERLGNAPPISVSASRALQMDLELALQSVRTNDTLLARIRAEHADAVARGDVPGNVQELSNEELLSHVRKPYLQFLYSALSLMDDEAPYEEVYAKIENLVDDLGEQVKRDPVSKIIAVDFISLAKPVPRFYTTQVDNTAHLNALSIALALYSIKAKTGQLPDALPQGLALDPYTWDDFLYNVTETGFSLRSPVRPRGGRRPFVLECVVR